MKVSNISRYIIYIALMIALLGSQISCALAPRGTITPSKSLDSIRADVGAKLDLGDPHIADTAMTIAADYPGEYNINQVCAIYDALARGGWYYYSDPSSGDSYQDANLTLQRGKISNTIGRGNCNDFAILMASLIESLGGSTRITFAYDTQNASGHAYAEVFLGDDGTAQVEDILRWLRSEYNLKALPGINKTGNKIWLNLDWGTDPAKAAYPGGPYFDEKDQGIGRYIVWEQNHRISPMIVPIIDSMDGTQGWEIVKDTKGSSINISSTPGRKGNAVQVSYNLTAGGWAGIAKQIDPNNLTSVAGLNFSYFAMGNQNTMELRLDYDNGTSFGVSWSRPKIDAWSSEKALYTDFVCLTPQNMISFDLRDVRRIEFIISNHPGNAPGSGTILLDEVRGVMAIPAGSPWARAEEQRETILANNLAWRSEQMTVSTQSDMNRKILLAVESLRHGQTLQGDSALRQALMQAGPQLAKLFHKGFVFFAEFSSDGTKVVTASNDNTSRIWDAYSGRELVKLRHEGVVYSAEFSPDGTKVVTASYDNTSRIWDAYSGRELVKLRHEGVVYSAEFSPDGTKVVTASSDDTSRIWDADSGQELVKLPHEDKVISAKFSPDGTKVITITSNVESENATAQIWDANSGQKLVMLPDNRVPSAEFSPDGTKVVTASYDGTARIWNARSGQELIRLPHDDYIIGSVAFSPDGTKVVTASIDRTVIWDAGSGQELIRLPNYHDHSAEFSPDGTKVVTTSYDGAARVWDVGSGQELASLPHDNWVYSAEFSPDGTKVVTASSDNTSRIWDTISGQELFKLRHVNSAEFSPDGTKVVTASSDNTSRIWDAGSGRKLFTLTHEGRVNSAKFSPDGTKVVTASSDNTSLIWDASSGRELASLPHGGRVQYAEFSPDGTKVVTAGDNRTVIWDASSGRKLIGPREDYGDFSAEFSPDGTKVVTVSYDGMARIWNAGSGQELVKLTHKGGWVSSPEFSPDGTRLLTVASDDNMSRIWDTGSGRELASLPHGGWVQYAEFSPDGTKVVTACSDGKARIWDASSGRELVTLSHEGWVNSAKFSPDGTKVVTASSDNTARIWDTSSGQELARLPHNDWVHYAEFSPDGAEVVTVCHDDTARIWLISSQELIKLACSRITENLTSQEWKLYLGESECKTCPREGRSSQWECQPCGGNFSMVG